MAKTEHAVGAGMQKLARWLVLGLPVFLVLGPAPADIALSLVAIMFLVRSVLTDDWGWAGEPWVRICMIVWGWLLFVSLFAVDPLASFGVSVVWFRFFVFAAALQYWVMDEAWLKRCIAVMGVVVVLVALDAVIQYVRGVDIFGFPAPSPYRLTGPMRKMVVGMYLSKLMYLPLVAGLYWGLKSKDRVLFIGVILAAGLVMVAVVLSGERTATLLMMVGFAVVLISLRQIRRYLLMGGSVVVLLGGALILTAPNLIDRHITQTITTLKALPQSPYGQLWMNGLSIGLANPVFGVGLKNFRLVCDEEEAGAIPEENEDRCGTHTHNYYIEWFAETGLPGVFFFLLLAFGLIRAVLPALRQDIWWLGGGVAALLIHFWPFGSTGSFFNNWNSIVMWLPFGLTTAGLQMMGKLPR